MSSSLMRKLSRMNYIEEALVRTERSMFATVLECAFDNVPIYLGGLSPSLPRTQTKSTAVFVYIHFIKSRTIATSHSLSF